MITETGRELARKEGFEPHHAFEMSSTALTDFDSSRLESASFTSGPCTGFSLPNQTGQSTLDSDTASVLESFLLWPLEDVSGYPNMAFNGPSTPEIPSNITGTVNQPTNMLCGAVPVTELPAVSQYIPMEAEDASRPSCITQPEISRPETSLTEEDRDILISEDYGHIPKPSIPVYESICGFYKDLSLLSPKGPLPQLYSLDVLHVCVQVYFEHFHRTFPILHEGTFEARSSSWFLYLAVAAVGSQYSRISFRIKISSDLVKAMRLFLLRTVCPILPPGTPSSSHHSNIEY